MIAKAKAAGPGLDFTGIIYEKKYHTELEGSVAWVSVNCPEGMWNGSNGVSGSSLLEICTQPSGQDLPQTDG